MVKSRDDIKNIATYWSKEEFDVIHEKSISLNISMSKYIKNHVLSSGEIHPMIDIDPEWIELAEREDMSIKNLLITAVRVYQLPVSKSNDEHLLKEISRLKDQNQQLQNQIISLKAPRRTLKQVKKDAMTRDQKGRAIFNRLLDAKGKYVQIDELMDVAGLEGDIADYDELTDILNHLGIDMEYYIIECDYSRGYRLKKVGEICKQMK